jgi:hypothetical protein
MTPKESRTRDVERERGRVKERETSEGERDRDRQRSVSNLLSVFFRCLLKEFRELDQLEKEFFEFRDKVST